MTRRRWSPLDAGEAYADWEGEAWADQHVLIRHPSLSEAVGLDADRWRIVAIDLVLAQGSDGEIILTAQEGDMPAEAAVEFRVTGIPASLFLSRVFTEFHAALVVRGGPEQALEIVERRELPFVGDG
ncbi:hypothetical protein [Leifsonia sp. AG29]|uniref:hypothetical protein n=1 Tax=Leifsonia sp. AG29 TaxID=2598860 RepID=UPI00131AE2F1|nr:hypothetical protein [Leifsonia sp. AG29]